MKANQNPKSERPYPATYQIRLEGHLSPLWEVEFDGLTLTVNGSQTCLTGPVVDQAALYGLLRKVRDLGLPLISVTRLEATQSEGHSAL